MGKIICHRHGEQSFHEICEHLYSCFVNGIKSPVHSIGILNLRLCANCYETHTFKEINNLSIEKIHNASDSRQIEETLTNKYNLINKKVVCAECYSDFNKKTSG